MLLSLCVFAVTLGLAYSAHWAVLAAGSNEWYNYRHQVTCDCVFWNYYSFTSNPCVAARDLHMCSQADIYHAYQILLNHGVPKSNIITFQFDDIVHNSECVLYNICKFTYNYVHKQRFTASLWFAEIQHQALWSTSRTGLMCTRALSAITPKTYKFLHFHSFTFELSLYLLFYTVRLTTYTSTSHLLIYKLIYIYVVYSLIYMQIHMLYKCTVLVLIYVLEFLYVYILVHVIVLYTRTRISSYTPFIRVWFEKMDDVLV